MGWRGKKMKMKRTKKMKRSAKGPKVMCKSDSVIVKKYINMKMR